jgi:aminomethyltransferase
MNAQDPHLSHTPLFEQHLTGGAKIVDFGGWALPVNYGSQIEEHNAVRTDCGLFDVSNMTVSDINGPQTLAFLSHLLANDIQKVSNTPGKALYSCMLNNEGGVIDDLIVYHINDQHCRMVTNANTNKKDMAWITQHAKPFDISFKERPELAIIAIQGPNALLKCAEVLEPSFAKLILSLARFQGGFLNGELDSAFAGRTGYTGEDGIEFILGAELAQQIWGDFVSAGIQACGLGARDTLRLESGMMLYGNDLGEDYTPLESGIAWSVAAKDDRDFIGKAALTTAAQYKMIGLILQGRGVLRGHQKVVLADNIIGEVTSGTFSPSLKQSIALARVAADSNLTVGDQVQIEIRDKQVNAVVAKFPFIKNGLATNQF